MTTVVYDKSLREYVIQSVMDADEAEAVAIALGNDGWARDLEAAAKECRYLNGEGS